MLRKRGKGRPQVANLALTHTQPLPLLLQKFLPGGKNRAPQYEIIVTEAAIAAEAGAEINK